MSTAVAFHVVLDLEVGATEPAIQKNLSVFPNPTTGMINVTWEDIEVMSLSVYEFNGKIINDSIGISIHEQSAQIDLSSQPGGVYYIEAQIPQGKIRGKVVLVK